MILEQETYDKFGYYPSELSKGSNKKILVKCNDCGVVREISKRNYTKAKYPELCSKCFHKKQKPPNRGECTKEEVLEKVNNKQENINTNEDLSDCGYFKRGYSSNGTICWRKGHLCECGRMIADSHATRCKICHSEFAKGKNAANWRGGISTRKNYCINCGIEIWKGKNRKYCRSCSRKEYLKSHPDMNPMKNSVSRANNSESHRGKIPWNKGLTKEIDNRIKSPANKCEPIKCICKWCNVVFYVEPNLIKSGKKGVFCSIKCRAAWQSEYLSGENSPTWKGGGKEYICQWCGKTFKIHGREKSRKYERKFCSRVCYTEWQLKNMQGEKSWGWKGGGIKRTCKRCGNDFYVKRSTVKSGWGIFCSKKCAFPEKIRCICKECNKEFYVAPNVIKHGGGVFCNRECYQKWQKKHMGGEESPAYLDGNSFEPYCPNFNEEFKERVREFFGRRCFECNKTEKENGRKLSVHHVNYDKMVCCNDVKPLFVALCDRHHTKTRWNREYWEEYFTKRIMEEFGGKCYFTKEEMNEIQR